MYIYTYILAGYPASLGRKGGGGREGTVDPLNLVGLRRQSDRQHYVISRHRTSSGNF